MKAKQSDKAKAGAMGFTEAVFGYTNDGAVRFYLAEEGDAWRRDPDRFVQAHTSRCLRFNPGRRPVLALVREGSGLFFDDVEEWVFELEAKPNAWIAFDATQAKELVALAGAGDRLVLLGDKTTWATFVGVTP